MSQLDSTGQVVPFQYGDTAVRTVMVDGEPWFVLVDLCTVLGLTSPTRVADRLDADGVSVAQVIDSMGRKQSAMIVNEAGMYEVVIRSDKPDAVTFRRWITGTVLPEIRRTGSFGSPALAGAELLAHAVIEAQAMLAAKDERIAELEPKAAVAERFLDADGDLSVRDAAQALTRAGVGVGQNRLFTLLDRKYGWISRGHGDNRYRARQSAIESGYVSVLPQSHYHPRTGVLVLDPPQVRVTPKGMQRVLLDHRSDAVVPA
ncbi:phage antirepressor [Rhodococcoides corynebacterioides]|uniref:phage antirepressor n=1 Tax=Rhodococcoides corynebacterioides TaxID=53972 RepID=UPI003F7E565B